MIDLNEYYGELEKEIGELFENIDKDKELDLEEIVEYYYDKPVEFAEDILNFKPDDHQKEIMMGVLENKRTAVKSGQGVGKTAVVSIIILWYLFTRYSPKVVATSPSMNQLFTVLWSEVGKWINGTILEGYFEHTKTKVHLVGVEQTHFAVAKTASTREGMAGLHADNMLIIADETTGIDDDILETLIGTISGEDNKLLFISNPTKTNGIFFDCFHKDKKNWCCITVNAEDVERVNNENIQMLLEKFGSRDHPAYLVRVRGEFPEGNEMSIISRGLAISRIGIKPKIIYDNIEIFGLDVARAGMDNTVCYKSTGSEVKLFFEYAHANTMNGVGAIARACQDTPEKRHIVLIDGVGVGGPLVDRLNELIEEDYACRDIENYVKKVPNLEIIEINNGSSIVFEPNMYGNVIGEMFHYARDLLNDESLVMEDDEELIEDLTVREIAFKSDGKIIVEKKEKIKERIGRSPDRGDAWLMCIYGRKYV